MGFGKLALELKSRPSARGELRQKIESRASSLLEAVNDLLGAAAVALRKAKRTGLVVLIDGLDKIVLRQLPNGITTHDRLFLDRCDQLAALSTHVVYTVPISVVYSSRCIHIQNAFGAFTKTVGMIRIRGADKSPVTPQTIGMRKLWEMIQLRCKHAGLDIENVFDSPETCHYLCRMSGGHPRHLLMFMQEAVTLAKKLPISKAAAEQAVRAYANSQLREVPSEFWPELRQFDAPRLDIAKDKQHQEMLFSLYIFEYMNNQQWYEVNPVLRTLSPFQQS